MGSQGPSSLLALVPGSAAPSRDPPGSAPTCSRRAESASPGAPALSWQGSGPACSGLGLQRAAPPHRALCRASAGGGALGAQRIPAWEAQTPGVPRERLLSLPSLPPPRVPGSGRSPGFHEGVGTRGPRVGTRHAATPSSDLGALPSRNAGGGSSFRRPRHRILGGGAWQPPGECPRRAPKPAPPLTRNSLPLLLWRQGGRGPGS